MRTIIFILLFCPLFIFAQNSTVFIKLTDVKGQLIKGESTLKGFEKWIPATTIASGGKNNTLLNFTMTVSGTSADLKRAMSNGELLLNGQVTVLSASQTGGNPTISYTIKIEKIAVTECYEAMGCNNIMNTTVRLQATRIGWTYYDQTRTGIQVVSKKFGWDAEKQTEWTNF